MARTRQVDITEIAVVGELTDREAELTEKLLEIPPKGECVLYIDSPGGSCYTGLALMNLIRLRGIRATGIVTGECSSAALCLLAACERRLVTPLSILLFHPIKWQSEEHVLFSEAKEWARHFGDLETEMDNILAELFEVAKKQLRRWQRPGKYLTGSDLADAGVAELIDIDLLEFFRAPVKKGTRKRSRSKSGR